MKRNRIIFGLAEYTAIARIMNSGGDNEAAAFLLCKESISPTGATLVVNEVLQISPGEVLSATPSGMSISSRAVARALKAAADRSCSFVFVHSHPNGYPSFSAQDDDQEQWLFSTAHVRAPLAHYHGSLIWSDGRLTGGRLWAEAMIAKPITRVNVIGQRFQFYDLDSIAAPPSDFYSRQVLAFGSGIQALLRGLHVGIVGAGGTGSALLEQIVRLGVGMISIYDGDRFERSNVNRVYGSSPSDQGLPKVEIAERLVRSIGLGTTIRTFSEDISTEEVALTLRDCDVIFGCTDDQLGRSILTRLAVAYQIPVFDMGVKIDSDGDAIRAIEGRVTTLMHGEACLFCRGRITSGGVGGDSIRKFQPDDADQLEKDGYLDGAGAPAPSVVTFTTTIAAAAVTEFLHRLTGMLGPERVSTEALYLIHDSRIRTNRKDRREGCFCGNALFALSADRQPFLDLFWPMK